MLVGCKVGGCSITKILQEVIHEVLWGLGIKLVHMEAEGGVDGRTHCWY